MLTLPEELLLLALDEEKGSVRNSASIHHGMAGAILLELAIQKKIAMQETHLVVQDEQSDDPLLQEVLNELSKGKSKKLSHWIPHFTMKGSKLHKPVYHKLVEKRIVKEEEGRILGLFPILRHPVKNKKARRAIGARLESVIFRRKEVDTRTMCLLSLILACNAFFLLFDKEKGKEAKTKSKEILEKENARLGIEPSFPKAIEEQVHKAIQRTFIITHVSTGG